jgi:hypothetical protein
MKIFQSQSARTVFVLFLFAVGLLLSGCSSIKVVETWNQPSWSKPPYKKTMVLAIGYDENRIAVIEDILVGELGRGGVTAVAGHNFIPVIKGASRDTIVAAVRSAGADAVLSLQVLSKGDSRVTQGGQSGGIYGTATNVGGNIIPSAKTYEDAAIQTNLYDSASAELVWSATVTTYEADRETRVSRELARFFLERLRKDGFL